MTLTFAEDLKTKFRAGYPILAVNSSEEDRVGGDILLASWLATSGKKVSLKPDARNLMQTLFTHYADCACTIRNGELTIDAPKLIRLTRRLIEAKADSVGLVEGVLKSTAPVIIEFDPLFGFSHAAPTPVDLADAIVMVTEPFDKAAGLVAPADDIMSNHKKNRFPWKCWVVFKSCAELLNQPGPEGLRYRRALQYVIAGNKLNVSTEGKEKQRMLIFSQPDWAPHPDVADCVHFVDFDPPDEAQLNREVSHVEANLQAQYGPSIVCPPDLRPDIVAALRGLTQVEVVNALSYATSRHSGFQPEMVPTLHRLKAETFKRDEVLQYVDVNHIASSDQIGGYENYLGFIAECKAAYGVEARAAGLPRPKGALLLGIPGTGKSMVAMATARLMNLPLITYDFGAVFGGIVGQSEATQRQTLRRVRAMGPCVLLIDEADKAFGGVNGPSGDGGVSRRLFGRLLTWMATENKDAFVIMTMNSLDGVPKEMLRKGRLDEVFYTEFPGPDERKQILAIHMRKNGVNPDAFDEQEWAQIAKHTEDFIGAELEHLAVRAVRAAWKNRQRVQPTFAEVEKARASIIPIAKLGDEEFKKILDFCLKAATPVSRQKEPDEAPTQQTGRNILFDSDQVGNN